MKNGPDVPNRLIEAHEDGRVVLFCGAGISSEAGLPSFEELVKKLGKNLEGLEDREKELLDAKKFDEVISLLEKRRVGGRKRVRRELARLLKPRSDAARKTHKALLTLSKNREGHTRLVTTNVDRMFEIVIKAEDERNEIKRREAPGLPVPDPVLWNALVYLHGLLPVDLGDEELDHLIFSSGDLGRAYLNEGWAARFVSELFRNFYVCFIGYSLGDPMLRYMTDALTVDKRLGKDSLEVFAFDKSSKELEKWSNKDITPILYDKYCYLHQTLHKWSDSYRDGIEGKQKIVANYASDLPSERTKQDDFVGRMLWALSDTSGLPAKFFADFDPIPSLEWLKPLSEEQDQQGNLIFFGVKQHQSSDRWDKVKRWLDDWLIKHLDDPDLILWLTKQGPLCWKFASKVKNRLEELDKLGKRIESDKLENICKNAPCAILRPAMRTWWHLLLSGFIKPESSQESYKDLLDWKFALEQFQRDGLTLSFRQELCNILTPRISVFQLFNSQKPGEPKEDPLDYEIGLSSNYVHTFLEQLRGESRWSEELPGLLDDFSRLLRDMMDLECELGCAGDKYYLSRLVEPSISSYSQDENRNDSTILITLCRDAWLQMAEKVPERARLVVETWRFSHHPVFHRLVFFALAQGDTFKPSQALDCLLSNNSLWLWSQATQPEVMSLLSVLVPRLSASQQDKLEEAILAGPQQQEFKNFDALEYLTWLRLDQVSRRAKLRESTDAKLNELTSQHPEWRKDKFCSDVDINEFTITTPRRRRDLVTWLKNHPNLPEDSFRDDWPVRCQKEFSVTASALLALAKDKKWLPYRWCIAFRKWLCTEKLINRSWRYMALVLVGISDDQLTEISFDISMWLEEVAETLTQHEDIFFKLCKRILELNFEERHEESSNSNLWINPSHGKASFRVVQRDSPLGGKISSLCLENSDNSLRMQAKKHPVGCVTQALLNWWFRGTLEKDQCLPEVLKPIFTKLCNPKIYKFCHGRALLSFEVVNLFGVDPNWSEQNLLPLFDWNTYPTEALTAWSCYPYSHRPYFPLLRKLKDFLIDTASHYEKFNKSNSYSPGVQYVCLLTHLALHHMTDQSQHEIFSVKELKKATKKLPKYGLTYAAETLVRMQKDAGQQCVQYWNNLILPYLDNIWPDSTENRTTEISESFAKLCIAAGDEFPSAVDRLRDWLQHLDYYQSCYLMKDLKDLGLCRKFPEQALEFLSKVIATSPRSWSATEHELLITCLNQIGLAKSKLKHDKRFKRLKSLSC